MYEHHELIESHAQSWDWILRLSARDHSINYAEKELCDSDYEYRRRQEFVIHAADMMQYQWDQCDDSSVDCITSRYDEQVSVTSDLMHWMKLSATAELWWD